MTFSRFQQRPDQQAQYSPLAAVIIGLVLGLILGCARCHGLLP